MLHSLKLTQALRNSCHTLKMSKMWLFENFPDRLSLSVSPLSFQNPPHLPLSGASSAEAPLIKDPDRLLTFSRQPNVYQGHRFLVLIYNPPPFISRFGSFYIVIHLLPGEDIEEGVGLVPGQKEHFWAKSESGLQSDEVYYEEGCSPVLPFIAFIQDNQ